MSEIKPKAFLIENVPGFVGLDDGETINDLLEAFRTVGYYTSPPFLVNAADYGIPQNRTRVFIIGSKSCDSPTFPESTNFPFMSLDGRPTYRTVAHALWGMPQGLPNHTPRNHKQESLRRYRKLRFGEREALGRVDRLDPRKPSKTVIAGGKKGGGRSHLHPYLARTLTVRECARIQSFPDDFVFAGSMGRQFTQVGNAVPPLLAYRIAGHVRATLFGSEYEGESKLEHMYPDSISLSELCSALLESATREDAALLYEVIDGSKSSQILMKGEHAKRRQRRDGRFSKKETVADNGIHTLEEY